MCYTLFFIYLRFNSFVFYTFVQLFNAMELKTLVKDTAIYGLSSIVGRFLNYLLVPLYTAKMSVESGNYGVVTNVYAWTAILLVLLTFGFETTFFRFASKENADIKRVFSMSMQVIGAL